MAKDTRITMKISPDTYDQLVKVKANCKRCKFNDDTIKMLIRFYRLHAGRV